MSKKTNNQGIYRKLLLVLLILGALSSMVSCGIEIPEETIAETEPTVTAPEGILEYSGSPYAVIADNIPGFTDEDLTTDAFETFAELDELGRCGVTYANVCLELMPTESRGDISSVYPSGWDNNPYDFVEGKYVYNRCHLIGFQLTGENANERNLITGTRYMNVQGMLPFENMVADHVKEEEHHVLYRVTPVFDGENLVADGVQMEALCVECHETADEDDDFFFNVYCFNVQPGVEIDYATGANWASEAEYDGHAQTYMVNTSSKKFHTEDCSNAGKMNEENRAEFVCTRQQLIDLGYVPAGCCNP